MATLVTPFVGVWIETNRQLMRLCTSSVTPFVGVWIETLEGLLLLPSLVSHTLRGCVD